MYCVVYVFTKAPVSEIQAATYLPLHPSKVTKVVRDIRCENCAQVKEMFISTAMNGIIVLDGRSLVTVWLWFYVLVLHSGILLGIFYPFFIFSFFLFFFYHKEKGFDQD